MNDGSLHTNDIAIKDDSSNHDHSSVTSLLTVDYEAEHEKAQAAAALGGVADLLNHSLVVPEGDEISAPESVDSDTRMIKSSVFEKVKYHDEIGKLVLTQAKITFHPYDGGSPTRGSFITRNHEQFDGSHSWRWKAIKKHQKSPANSAKNLLKLVSMDSVKKGVVFAMPSHEALKKISKDVSGHLKEAHQTDESKTKTSNGSQLSVPLESAHEGTALLGNPVATIDEQQELAEEVDGEGFQGRSHTLVWIGVVVVALLIAAFKVAPLLMPSDSAARMLSVDSIEGAKDSVQETMSTGIPKERALRYLRENLRH